MHGCLNLLPGLGGRPTMKSYRPAGFVTRCKATMRAEARRVAVAGSVLGVTLAGVVLTGVAASASTTYIVDNTNPACSDTASGAGTATLPFCTLIKGAAKA